MKKLLLLFFFVTVGFAHDARAMDPNEMVEYLKKLSSPANDYLSQMIQDLHGLSKAVESLREQEKAEQQLKAEQQRLFKKITALNAPDYLFLSEAQAEYKSQQLRRLEMRGQKLDKTLSEFSALAFEKHKELKKTLTISEAVVRQKFADQEIILLNDHDVQQAVRDLLSVKRYELEVSKTIAAIKGERQEITEAIIKREKPEVRQPWLKAFRRCALMNMPPRIIKEAILKEKANRE